MLSKFLAFTLDVAERIGVKGLSSGGTNSFRVFSSDLLGHHSLSPLCTAVYKGNMKCCGIVLGLSLQFEIEMVFFMIKT